MGSRPVRALTKRRTFDGNVPIERKSLMKHLSPCVSAAVSALSAASTTISTRAEAVPRTGG